MILKPYEDFLQQPLAFWIANANASHEPDLARCTGIAPFTDLEHLTFFIPEKSNAHILANATINSQLTLSATSVITYNSYQFKGVINAIRDCTQQEEEIQNRYLKEFSLVVSKLGFSKETFFELYNFQPSRAITFHVTEIFEQSPHKGTGNLVTKKEEAHGS